MGLSERTQARLEELRRRGCEVDEPREGDAGWSCDIRVPGGRQATGQGAGADEAARDAADRAEHLIDVVLEASMDSFPASDPPGY